MAIFSDEQLNQMNAKQKQAEKIISQMQKLTDFAQAYLDVNQDSAATMVLGVGKNGNNAALLNDADQYDNSFSGQIYTEMGQGIYMLLERYQAALKAQLDTLRDGEPIEPDTSEIPDLVGTYVKIGKDDSVILMRDGFINAPNYKTPDDTFAVSKEGYIRTNADIVVRESGKGASGEVTARINNSGAAQFASVTVDTDADYESESANLLNVATIGQVKAVKEETDKKANAADPFGAVFFSNVDILTGSYVDISALTPEVQPKVSDTVIDVDGDVYSITAVEDTRVQVGEAIIQFAVMTNVEAKIAEINETIQELNTELEKISGYFDEEGAAQNALKLAGKEASAYAVVDEEGKVEAAKTADALTDPDMYVTSEGYVAYTQEEKDKLGAFQDADQYYVKADVDKKVSDAVNNLDWKSAVDSLEALQAIEAPQEGWTVSVKDTNSVYRFDDAGTVEGDNVAATDGTQGAWILLSTSFYSVATEEADGLMSKDSVTDLTAAKENIAELQGYFENGIAKEAAKFDGHESSYFVTTTDIQEYSKTTEADAKYVAQDGYIAYTQEEKDKLAGIAPDTYALKTEIPDLVPYMKTEDANVKFALATALDSKADVDEDGKVANAKVADELTGFVPDDYAKKTDVPEEYVLPQATADVLGGIKVGGNVTLDENGNATVDLSGKADADTVYTKEEADAKYALIAALEGKADVDDNGKVANAVNADTLTGFVPDDYAKKTDIPEEYVLPQATEEVLGGIKLGGNVVVDTDGVASVDLSSKADADTVYTKEEADAKYALITALAGKADVDANGKVANAVTADALAGFAPDDYAKKTDIPEAYELPQATEEALGGIKLGGNVTLDTEGKANVDLSGMYTKEESDAKYALATALAAKADVNDEGKVTNAVNADTLIGFTPDDYAKKADIPEAYVLPQATADVLGGIKLGGNVVVDSNGVASVDLSALAAKTEVEAKVDKVDGKGLSTNDYDDTAKTKVDALADIKSVAAPLALNAETGELGADLSNYAVQADVTTALAAKMNTADADDKYVAKADYTAYELPAATTDALGGVKQGDNVTIAADGTISVAAPVDITNLATKTEVEAKADATAFDDMALAYNANTKVLTLTLNGKSVTVTLE